MMVTLPLALTDRDWDSAICGICGVCPIFESGDGNVKNCTPISTAKVYNNYCSYKYTSSINFLQIKWHDEADNSLRSGHIDVDEWWKNIDSKLLEV